MKRRHLFLPFAAVLLLVSAFTGNYNHPPFTVHLDPLVPVLPDEPYNYDISFPEHILFNPWGFVDSTLINSNISPEGATLGRVLFYDKKLSASNELACASCHKQELAFADEVAFSNGINGAVTERNSPNLNDIVWAGNFFEPGMQYLFWDAREADLESMVLQPIVHEGELGKDLNYLLEKLGATEYYPALFEDAFGTPEITPVRIGSALAQFVRSMATFDTKFDLVMQGQANFTAEEQAGAQLFEESCGQICHSQPHFATLFPMNTGLDSVFQDPGLGGWTNFEADIGKFKSPSLRNIELTSPYMHDGRFETLEEVIDFYSDEVFPHPHHDFHYVGQGGDDFTGFDFSDEEKSNLVAFLKTLTGQELMQHPKWSDPFQQINNDHTLPLEEKITIYPNPFSESTVIELDNNSGEIYRFRVTDLNGRVLRSFQTTTGTAIIEKDGLEAGIYMLEVRKGNKKKVERIVVQ